MSVTATTNLVGTATTNVPTVTNTDIGTGIPTLVLTTTFTPPPQCSTQFAQRGRIILNPMFPPLDPAQSTCYEEQFVSHYTAYGYDSLVCPAGYQTQSVFESPASYIACCPDGWEGLSLDNSAPSTRPAYLASCYSTIQESGLLVTFGDGLTSGTSTYKPTSSGEVAYAFPYDGIALSIETGGSIAPSSVPTFTASGAGKNGVVVGGWASVMLLFACFLC